MSPSMALPLPLLLKMRLEDTHIRSFASLVSLMQRSFRSLRTLLLLLPKEAGMRLGHSFFLFLLFRSLLVENKTCDITSLLRGIKLVFIIDLI